MVWSGFEKSKPNRLPVLCLLVCVLHANVFVLYLVGVGDATRTAGSSAWTHQNIGKHWTTHGQDWTGHGGSWGKTRGTLLHIYTVCAGESYS